MSKEKHVFGCFRTIQGARLAVDRLVDAGVPQERLGLLISPEARTHFATLTTHTKAAEGAATGGIAGGALGALVAGLTTVAAVAAPGVGLLAAGPLVSMFAGAGVGAAAGGTLGGLIGLGLPESEVKRVNEIITQEGVLVTLSTDDKQLVDTAERVLEESGATLVRTHDGGVATV